MTVDLERIAAAVREAGGQADELTFVVERMAELATPSSDSNLVFDNDEIQIRVGLGAMAPVVQKLRGIENLKISAAPVVAATYSATKTHVIALRYWACPGEQRVASSNPATAPEPARRRFRDDIARLAGAGFMHQYMMRGVSYWRQGAKTGTLLLDDWTNLVPVEDAAQMVQRLSTALKLT